VKVPMWLVRCLGAVVWLSAFGVDVWAPHKPFMVTFGASLALGVIGINLATWKTPR
jgi:hypothetical protein